MDAVQAPALPPLPADGGVAEGEGGDDSNNLPQPSSPRARLVLPHTPDGRASPVPEPARTPPPSSFLVSEITPRASSQFA